MRQSAKEIVDLAKEKLASALGRKAYGVSAFSDSGESWTVEVEVIEEEHLISSLDVIGIYDVQIDKEGNLIGWTRKGLRKRE